MQKTAELYEAVGAELNMSDAAVGAVGFSSPAHVEVDVIVGTPLSAAFAFTEVATASRSDALMDALMSSALAERVVIFT